MKKLFFYIVLLLVSFQSEAQKASWIAYPGEFEIWTHRKQMMGRTERGENYPSLWRVDSPYSIVEFVKPVSLSKPERASMKVDGVYFISGKNGIMNSFNPNGFILPAGDYNITVKVENFKELPSLFFQAESFCSDSTWIVNSLNGDYVGAEQLNFNDPDVMPSEFKLAVKDIKAISNENVNGGVLYDFGRETYAYPVLENKDIKDSLFVCYGESREEALAMREAETFDVIYAGDFKEQTLPAKAFRYIFVKAKDGNLLSDVRALYEYLPLQRKGKFECSDTLINHIYDVSYYTLELNTRYCHLDGIKRDRWVWSGDAYQSYLMNFYTFFDEDVNKRTLWGLRGHAPITKHINTILDYSFYWMLGVYEHYFYTGDATFLKNIYPRLVETMDFCISRLNKNNIAEGMPGDWVFVDWAPIEKDGELSFEQLLFLHSLKNIYKSALATGDKQGVEKYKAMLDKLTPEFENIFWSDEKNAYLHRRKNGVVSPEVTRYTNMFSILFNYADENKKEIIKNSVILNDSILKITTPYMKFYELAALCEIGEQKEVVEFVKNYWGGMLKLGATSMWEAFDPTLPDDKHYEMYGRPFGKSLCHAWGANPVYLFGKYYLGVKPTNVAYSEYEIRPNLGGLKWIKGEVPTKNGNIGVEVNKNKIVVSTPDLNNGTLYFNSKTTPKCKNAKIEKVSNNEYMIKLASPNTIYEVRYN
ncbi:MAG: alpha-rhamnosidase [Bacteroidales bacterium]|nr:alpha-rhamnosidase [Bacteroidales bacterium]